MQEDAGYRGPSLRIIKKHGLEVGDFISFVTKKGTYEGTLLPRYQYADDRHVVIKLRNGYNIGINVENIVDVKRKSKGAPPTFMTPPLPRFNPNLPKIAIISTGGTIASRVDYRTGAVHPALTASDLYASVPELAEHAFVEAEVLFSLYSENISPKHWEAMAGQVIKKIKDDYKGIVITHGTDTMGYTAAALSFALAGISIPVVLVGAQRSSDRPSSDASTNLAGAVRFASETDLSGVFLVMHSNPGDDELTVHLGTKVRKNHTSRRDAFSSVNSLPAAYIKNGDVKQIIPDLPKRESGGFQPRTHFEDKVGLIKFHPGADPEIIDFLAGKKYRGVVLEGTGLGHVSSAWFESIKKAISSGMTVCMTSQCLWGRTRMTVYNTGRDLLMMDVLPLQDILPETALVKLMWTLGNFREAEEIRSVMLRNIAMEFSPRSLLEHPAKS